METEEDKKQRIPRVSQNQKIKRKNKKIARKGIQMLLQIVMRQMKKL